MALPLRVAVVSLLAPVLGCGLAALMLVGASEDFEAFLTLPLFFAVPGSMLLLTPGYAMIKGSGWSLRWRYAGVFGIGGLAGALMLLPFGLTVDGGYFGMATALCWIGLHVITRPMTGDASVWRGALAGGLTEPGLWLGLMGGLIMFAGLGSETKADLIEQPLPRMAETKDRLSEDEMERLVAAAMVQARDGDMAAADALFERQVMAARETGGLGSVQEADLLMAFGVQLFSAGAELEDLALQRASAPYLARSIDTYRAAFGRDSAEVAVALNSHADVLLLLNDNEPVAAAEAELEEALRIRTAALGRRNVETIATRKQLARLRGHPSRVQGDRVRLAAAAAEFEAAIADASGEAAARNESAPMLRLDLAQMYLDNGEHELAKRQAKLAKAGMASWSEAERSQAQFQLMLMDYLD